MSDNLLRMELRFAAWLAASPLSRSNVRPKSASPVPGGSQDEKQGTEIRKVLSFISTVTRLLLFYLTVESIPS
jgi:hypothetical protein